MHLDITYGLHVVDSSSLVSILIIEAFSIIIELFFLTASDLVSSLTILILNPNLRPLAMPCSDF